MGIPLKIHFFDKNNSSKSDLEFNIYGIQLCTLDKEPFKSEGRCGGKNRSERLKFTCIKSHKDKKRKCYHTCETPCTNSKAGRMTYVYPDKDFRIYLGVQRNSLEWITTYKKRTLIDGELSCFKFNPSIQHPNAVNTVTILKAIPKLINVIVADAVNNIKYIRTTRKLFAIPA